MHARTSDGTCHSTQKRATSQVQINGLVQISWCPLQQINRGLSGFIDPQESLPDGAFGFVQLKYIV